MIHFVVLFVITTSGLAHDDIGELIPIVPESIELLDVHDFNRLHQTDFTPYAAYAYQYLEHSMIFDTFFNLPTTPEEAFEAYYDSGITWSRHLGAINVGNLPLKLAQSGQQAFIRGVNVLDFYKSFLNTMEAYWWKVKIMTLDNSQHLGYLYYLELNKMHKTLSTSSTYLETFHALTVGDANHVSTFGDVLNEDVIYMIQILIQNVNQL